MDWQDFLAAPIAEVAQVAPRTMVYTMGGTRRSAALAGIVPESDAYIRWTREQLVAGLDLLFRYGVEHVFVAAITPDNFQETGAYRKRLIGFTDWALAGEEALADYGRFGWRVRLLGSEHIPELKPTADRLRQETPAQSRHTLWCLAIPHEDAPWQTIVAAAQSSGAQTRETLIEAIYGEMIPPITMFLSTGKLMFSQNLLPPLLTGKVQCYWRQKPGHTLREQEWREILYDYAYTRATWKADKEGRAEAAISFRHIWETAPTIGLGQRLGPFWYPAPTVEPPAV